MSDVKYMSDACVHICLQVLEPYDFNTPLMLQLHRNFHVIERAHMHIVKVVLPNCWKDVWGTPFTNFEVYYSTNHVISEHNNQ